MDESPKVSWSTDGVNWTESNSSGLVDFYFNYESTTGRPVISYGGGVFLTAGTNTTDTSANTYKVAVSEDGGETWKVLDLGVSGGSWEQPFTTAYGTPGGIPTFIVGGTYGKMWVFR
jgi:hypothetical protein